MGWRTAMSAIAIALAGCATGTVEGADGGEALAPPDAERPATPLDAAPTPDAATAAPDATPPPDAVALSTCEAAALMPDNDACGDAIDLTSLMTAGAVVVHGDTSGYADTTEPPTSCTSGWSQDGPDAVYRIDASVGDRIDVTLVPEGFDGSIYLLMDCANPGSCLAGTDAGSGTAVETLSHTAVADAPHYLVVDSYRAGEDGCFTLTISVP
jgi:hypothetical protein